MKSFFIKISPNQCSSLPAAIASSALNVAIELYFLTRLYSLVVPEFLRAKHRREAMRDIRLGRALSLLIFDVLTVMCALTSFHMHML